MDPLRVQAHVSQRASIPGGWLALDALLMAAVSIRDRLPAISARPTQELKIPLALEPSGRFHLASHAPAVFSSHEKEHVNRRPVIAEAQALGNSKFRRLNLSTGPNKAYRIPLEVGFLEAGVLEWWCVGDAEQVRALLALVTAVGKKRSVGHGKVDRWMVEPCEPWSTGFPLVRDGQPTRPLPIEWPGLAPEGELRYAVLTPPYWEKHREQVLRVPAGAR